jgi:hypothetical protein
MDTYITSRDVIEANQSDQVDFGLVRLMDAPMNMEGIGIAT